MKRIQTRIVQTRTTTTIFETEETNTHTFDNSAGQTQHVSGLYRWLDKEYRAQVYNYGKRMMFEFVLPEPAALLVEARLRAYETSLDVPQPPSQPNYEELPDSVNNLTAADITPDRFKELRRLYDFGDLEYPRLQRTVEFVNPGDGQKLLL